MGCSYKIPADFWGLTLAELRQAIAQIAHSGIRLTNKSYSYRGFQHSFDVSDIGQWKITAPSQKRLKFALDHIQSFRRKKLGDPA